MSNLYVSKMRLFPFSLKWETEVLGTELGVKDPFGVAAVLLFTAEEIGSDKA